MEVMEIRSQPSELNSPIPENHLPPAWWDEEEISYFFSPFRSYNQNPDDKENKIKFWRPIILKWCEHQICCSFTVMELERAFTKNQLVPACMAGVIEDMLRKRQVCTKDDFLLIPPQTWSGWALDLLVKRPVGWSLKKAKELIVKTQDDKIYVLIEAAKLQANILLLKQKESGKGPVLSKSDVKQLVPDMNDLEIVLHWLLCQNKIVCTKYKDQELIKFCGTEEKLLAITETDIGIYALQNTEKSLCGQLEKLEAEKLAAIEAAKSYVAKGMKQMAKSSLRKKHQIEKILDRRATVLDNVQSLLTQIQDAHSDSKILETYQEGLAALKCSMKEANLTDDNVSSTMLELNEVLDVHNDIQESMSQTISSNTSDQELEDELEKLLIAELPPAPKGDLNLFDLPSVPGTKLVNSSTKKAEMCD